MSRHVDSQLDAARRILAAYIEEERLSIPVLPTVAMEMLRLYKDPDANARGMADLIQGDQSLVGSVLRVCNSAAYGGVRPITSLQLAIARLGIRVLGRIAVSHIVRGKIFSAAAHEEEMDRLWRHVQLTAVVGADLARLCQADPEEAYLCGLLHAIGMPTAYQALEDLKGSGELAIDDKAEVVLAEEFGGRVGHKLAREWKLPEVVWWTCLHADAPDEAPEAFRQTVAIVHLGGILASFLSEASADAALDEAAAAAGEDLGLSPGRVQAFVNESEHLKELALELSR